MTQAVASVFKIPTESPQPARGSAIRARQARAKPKAAVWHEDDERQQCEWRSQSLGTGFWKTGRFRPAEAAGMPRFQACPSA
jgi:hypothetical protein